MHRCTQTLSFIISVTLAHIYSSMPFRMFSSLSPWIIRSLLLHLLLLLFCCCWSSSLTIYNFLLRLQLIELSRRAFFDCEKCIPNKTHPLSHPTTTHEFIGAYFIQILTLVTRHFPGWFKWGLKSIEKLGLVRSLNYVEIARHWPGEALRALPGQCPVPVVMHY